MNTGYKWLRSLTLALATALALSVGPVLAAEAPKENPGIFAMTGDLMLARPLMLATTVLGTAIFVVSSPFSLLGGNIKDAANTLVYDPFKATFVRCLGCAHPREDSIK